MADTFTAKLGLRQYDASLFYDVSKFSADNLLIDNAFGTVICTSTTRPSTGIFNGMTLWETDTRRIVVRVAGAWVPVPTRVVVADATARAAITTPYDGMEIYRQDRDWSEIYDGATWRVRGVAHCSSTADRDSAITSPYNGQLVVTTDTGTLWRRHGGAWVTNTPGSVSDNQNTTGTTTSTSYTSTLSGGTACGVAFVAPPSGNIVIENKVYFYNSNEGTNFSFATVRVRTGGVIGSGTDVLAANDTECAATSQVSAQTATIPLNGLTPGTTYNAQQLFRVDGGTGTFQYKRLIIRPA